MTETTQTQIVLQHS